MQRIALYRDCDSRMVQKATLVILNIMNVRSVFHKYESNQIKAKGLRELGLGEKVKKFYIAKLHNYQFLSRVTVFLLAAEK